MSTDRQLARDKAIRATDLPAALLAAEIARSLDLPLVLISATNAGIYAGGGWWKALTDQVARAQPALNIVAILDCGDHTGAALGAIRAGCRDLAIETPASALIRFAAAHGVTLHQPPTKILALGRLNARTGSLIRRFLSETS